jgi:hypothetical protein
MTREELIEDVCSGKRSIEEAENLAVEKGIGPIEIDCPFDPRRKANWTLAEALIWIKYRDYGAVKRANDFWRENSKFFKLNSDPKRPYLYGPEKPITYFELMQILGTEARECFDLLQENASKGEISTYCFETTNKKPTPIKPYQWNDTELAFHLKTNQPVIRYRRDGLSWIDNNGFDAIDVKSDELQQLYVAKDHTSPICRLTERQICEFFEKLIEERGSLPRLDVLYEKIHAIDRSWTYRKLKPIFKRYTKDRGKGRPKKIAK